MAEEYFATDRGGTVESGSSDITVRAAQYRDWPQLARLVPEIFPELGTWIAAYLHRSFDGFGVAVKGARILGFYEFKAASASSTVRLDYIGVARGWQQKGVGGALLAHFERRAAALGFQAIELSVLEDNPEARRFYERRGYECLDSKNCPMGITYRYVKRLPGSGAAVLKPPSLATRLYRRFVRSMLIDLPGVFRRHEPLANPAVTLRAYRGREGLAELAPAWRELAASLPGSQYYQFPEWYECSLGTLVPHPERVYFFAIYREGRLAAVIPLRAVRLRVAGLTIRILELVQHTHMYRADAIVAGGEHSWELFLMFIRWLPSQRDISWDMIRLERIGGLSVLGQALAAAPSLRCLHQPGNTGSAFFDANRSADTLMQSLSGDFRRNLRRLARRAEAGAPLHFESCDDISQLPAALDSFLELEASGWKGKEGTGTAISCDPQLVAFYHDLVERFGRKGQCVINLLRLGETPVAAQFCLRTGGALNILKIGYSADHAAIGPGYLLLERVLRDACADAGINTVSLVTSPPWSHLWKPQQDLFTDYQIFASTLRGRSLYRFQRLRASLKSRAVKPSVTTSDKNKTS